MSLVSKDGEYVPFVLQFEPRNIFKAKGNCGELCKICIFILETMKTDYSELYVYAGNYFEVWSSKCCTICLSKVADKTHYFLAILLHNSMLYTAY